MDFAAFLASSCSFLKPLILSVASTIPIIGGALA